MCEMVCIHVHMCVYTLTIQSSVVKCDYESEEKPDYFLEVVRGWGWWNLWGFFSCVFL